MRGSIEHSPDALAIVTKVRWVRGYERSALEQCENDDARRAFWKSVEVFHSANPGLELIDGFDCSCFRRGPNEPLLFCGVRAYKLINDRIHGYAGLVFLNCFTRQSLDLGFKAISVSDCEALLLLIAGIGVLILHDGDERSLHGRKFRSTFGLG